MIFLDTFNISVTNYISLWTIDISSSVVSKVLYMLFNIKSCHFLLHPITYGEFRSLLPCKSLGKLILF